MQSNQSAKTVRQANGWKSINNGVTTGGIFLALLPSQTTCASRSCRFRLAFASLSPLFALVRLKYAKKLCLFYRLSLLLPMDGPTRDIIWETLDRKGVSCRMVIFGVNRCPNTHSLLFFLNAGRPIEEEPDYGLDKLHFYAFLERNTVFETMLYLFGK